MSSLWQCLSASHELWYTQMSHGAHDMRGCDASRVSFGWWVMSRMKWVTLQMSGLISCNIMLNYEWPLIWNVTHSIWDITHYRLISWWIVHRSFQDVCASQLLFSSLWKIKGYPTLDFLPVLIISVRAHLRVSLRKQSHRARGTRNKVLGRG